MTIKNNARTIITQSELPGLEKPASQWEIIELTLPNGHTRLMARKIN